jgi:hypothetical protein
MFTPETLRTAKDGVVDRNRFRQVELTTVFKQIPCYRCDFVSIYQYRVQQVRRHAEIESREGEAVREDHREIFQSIPRFAEIPETLKCRRCGEVLGLYTSCIF